MTLAASGEVAIYSDTNAVTVFSPSVSAQAASPDGDWSVNGSYLADVVSAASVDIVSSASSRWTEVRHEAGLGLKYQLARASLRGSFSASSEPDYLFLGGGALVSFELSSKSINPLFGYSVSHDTAGRVGTPFSIFSQELYRHTLVAGVELVMDRSTVLLLEADGILERGDSSKPYRYLPLFSAENAARVQPGASLAEVNQLRLPGRIGERVPGQRLRLALMGRLSRRFAASTFQAAERLYVDDWGLMASSSELRYLLDVSSRWVGWAGARAHLQTGVFFWNRAYVSELGRGGLDVPEYRTGDRELSPLVTLTAGAGVRYGLGSESRPQSTSISLQLDESSTHFRDALYLESRLSHLLLLQLQREL